MGQSGAQCRVPSWLRTFHLPSSACGRAVVGGEREKPAADKNPKTTTASPRNLRQRAVPLIELLERAAKQNTDVIWEEETRTGSDSVP